MELFDSQFVAEFFWLSPFWFASEMKPGTTPKQLVGQRLVDTAAGGQHERGLYDFDKIAPSVLDFPSITQEHIDQYHEQGFLVIERAFTESQVRNIVQALEDFLSDGEYDPKSVLFEAWADGTEAESVRKVCDFTSADSRLQKVVNDSNILSLVSRLMHGARPSLLQEMALLKPAGGREKPWHQDRAYFNVEWGRPVVGTWIALDKATPENGCMRLWTGRHRGEPFTHFQRRDWQICDRDIERHSRVAVPLEPGGLLLFDSLLPHGTPYNPTDSRRWAVQFHYCPEDARLTDDEERMAIFGEEGKDVEC